MLAGILYPNAFQVTEMIKEMEAVHEKPLPFHYFNHKNLELGAWKNDIFINKPKDICALFDGEIYNKNELYKELKNLGFIFETESNSELIAHAYDAWKEKFLERINGPFALAIFDEKKENLLLARDRLGQKVIYWAAQGDYWLFSTDINSLLSTGLVPQTPAYDALASYLYFSFIPQDLSSIHNVKKLLPCHYLQVNLKREAIINQYWSLSDLFEQQQDCAKDELYNQLGKHLENAVKISLPEKGEVGSFLANNLGAACMSWFLTHTAPRERLSAYTPDFEKVEVADTIAKTLSIKHETEIIDFEKAIDELPKIVWYLDEPVADPFMVQAWHLGKIAKSSHMYTDLGWKEMFAGSSHYFNQKHHRTPLAFILAKLPKKIRSTFLFPLLKFFGSNYLYKVLRNIDLNQEHLNYLMNEALFKRKTRKKVSPFLYKAFDPEVFTQRFHRLNALCGHINPSLYYDAKTKLPDKLLHQYEKLLSSHNIEMVAPFLDHRLVKFVTSIPENMKCDEKIPGSMLHHLMEKLCHTCPDFPKRSDGYIKKWCKSERLHKMFKLLENGRLVEEGIISSKWLIRQLNRSLTPKKFKQLWAILVLEVWFRLYVNKPIDMANKDLSLEDLLRQ